MRFCFKHRSIYDSTRGGAALEFALIVPLLCIIVFAIIDFGRLINARLVVTNVSREGGSLASRYRDIEIETEGEDILNLLEQSAVPYDITGPDGKLIISKITGGTLSGPPTVSQVERGDLGVESGIGTGSYLGLTPELYDHLVFKEANQTSDIAELTVVEVFLKCRPITPLSAFIGNILTPDDGGRIIGSRSIF